MPIANRMSVVLPVRNGQDRIAARIQTVLDLLAALTDQSDAAEIVVVDDGSYDATVAVVQQLENDHRQIRLVRHDRPRGLEAAGQTGLERSTGDLIFIQEHDVDIRVEDMRK